MTVKVQFIILSVIYRIILDISYCWKISPSYSYRGLIYNPNSYEIIILSYFLIIISSALMPLKRNDPSFFIIGFLYLVGYIPTTSLMSFASFQTIPVLWLTLVYIFLIILSRKQIRFNLDIFTESKKIINILNRKREIFILLLFLTYTISGFILVSKFGFRMPTRLLEIYDLRLSYKATSGSIIIGYIYIWMGNVIIPFVAVWALLNKRIIILSFAIICQLSLFAVGGFKSQFIAIVFILWIIFGEYYFKKYLMHYIACSFIILLSSMNAVDAILNTHYANGIVTRRIFFVPAELYFYYYEFFSTYQHTYFSQSKLFGWLINYPYNLPIPHLIASIYRSSAEAHANANIWADSYASLGVFGMFLIAIILWFFIKIIDYNSKDKNIYLIYALIAMPLFSLTNTGLLIAFMTHGGLLSIILIVLLPKNKKSNKYNNSEIVSI